MGAFGGSSIGRIGMGVAGAVTGSLSSVLGDIVNEFTIDIWGALVAGVVGGAAAFIAGPGQQNGKTAKLKQHKITRKQIKSNKTSGKYSSSQYKFGLKSNGTAIKRATHSLNLTAIKSLIFDIPISIMYNLYELFYNEIIN